MEKKRYGRGEFYAGNHIKLTEENNKQHFSRNFKAFSGKKNKLNGDNSEDKVYEDYDGDTEEYGNTNHKFNDEIKTFNLSGHDNSIKINGNVRSINISGHDNSIKINGNVRSINLSGHDNSIKINGNARSINISGHDNLTYIFKLRS